jgi:hypothetical protein
MAYHFHSNLFQMAKMIAVTTPMKLTVKKRTTLAPPANLLATTANASIIIWFATKFLTARTTQTSLCIVMSMNVLKLRCTSVVTSVWTR